MPRWLTACFSVGFELGRGAPEVGQKEVRVVAEPAGAARRVDHLALPAALGDQRLGVVGVADEHDDAVIVCAAVGSILQQRDELRVVALVGLRLAGKPRRMHAGLAVEGRDADPGVVGQRGKLCVPRGVPRLRERILDERRVRLFGVRHAERALRHDLDPERREQLAELAELARIGRCEDELLHRLQAPSAARCFAISSRMPRSASATRDTISTGVNGAPSAVPCSSTKPPAPVITTFMSVSQAESSA